MARLFDEASLAAYNARRARWCAVEDGHAEQEQDKHKARAPADRVPEKVVLPSVLEALALHRRVAWVSRVNIGGAVFGGRYVKFGERGMCDITGQLTDGRRLEVECKASDGELRPEQRAFIDMVNAAHGVAFVARSIDDVITNLGSY